MCSLSLYTKVTDVRDLLCNIAYYYDNKYNVPFTEEDNVNKCMIFDIPDCKTDFITGGKVGTGDHWFPIAKEWKKNKIGSDSKWNIIPVSGNNSMALKYNQLKKDILNGKKIDSKYEKYSNIIKKWLMYVESRKAKLYYNVPDKFYQVIDDRNSNLRLVQDECLTMLYGITPLN